MKIQRLASMIMRTVVPVQIIEYRSPKYMHMLTGKFIENWTEKQGICNTEDYL